MMLALLLAVAAPPDAAPGFSDSGPPAPVFARPKHDAALDPAIAQLVVARLVQLHLLDSAADALDAVKAAGAIKGFQTGVGLKPTGVLDRKTLALLALQ